eukprot:7282627-Prorocentrum_lima.AAC.1
MFLDAVLGEPEWSSELPSGAFVNVLVLLLPSKVGGSAVRLAGLRWRRQFYATSSVKVAGCCTALLHGWRGVRVCFSEQHGAAMQLLCS